MNECKYCNGTGKILLLFSTVDCECVEKIEPNTKEKILHVELANTFFKLSNKKYSYTGFGPKCLRGFYGKL